MLETGNNTNQAYSLSIRIHADGFSFYSCNPLTDKGFKKEDYFFQPESDRTGQILSAVNQSVLIHEKQHAQYNLLLQSPVTHVPMELFRKEETELLFNFSNTKAKTPVQILYNILPRLEIVEIFRIEEQLYSQLTKQFPNIRYYAQNSMLLEKMASHQTQYDTGKKLYVYSYNKRIFLFHYKNNKLLFANEFKADNHQSALYLLLHVWKNLEFDAYTDECIFLAPGEYELALMEKVREYLKSVYELSPTVLFRRAALTRIPQIPFDLLTLLLNGF